MSEKKQTVGQVVEQWLDDQGLSARSRIAALEAENGRLAKDLAYYTTYARELAENRARMGQKIANMEVDLATARAQVEAVKTRAVEIGKLWHRIAQRGEYANIDDLPIPEGVRTLVEHLESIDVSALLSALPVAAKEGGSDG